MQDYREVLAKLQEQFKVEEDAVNTIDIVEEINPNLTQESVAYKDNKKLIFKQVLSYENAQDIVETIRKVEGVSIENYREKVNKVCSSAWIMKESPIEMMVYATKGLKDEKYLNVVLDILKSLGEKDEKELVASYYNILKNWNWNECIKTVLKSLQDLRIKELSKPVYHIFETNEVLRKEAALTIIAMGETNYFEGIINFLVMRSNDTREQLDEVKQLMVAMGHSDEASALIYKAYIDMNMRLEVANQLIPGIRRHISMEILKQAERLLNDPYANFTQQRKAVRLLERCDSNAAVKTVIDKVRSYEHLKRAWSNQTGSVMELQGIKQLINSKGLEHRDTLNAILALGKATDDKSKEILYTFSEKTELLKIIANSALAERGDKQRLVKLCTYIIEPNKDEKLVYEAIGQIRRLRFLQNESLSKDLLSITNKLLDTFSTSPDPQYVMSVLSIYEVGIPTDEIGKMYLTQLKVSKHVKIQQMALDFLVKNHSKFNALLQTQIHNELIKLSQSGTVFAKQAMAALGKISKSTDAVPVMIKTRG